MESLKEKYLTGPEIHLKVQLQTQIEEQEFEKNYKLQRTLNVTNPLRMTYQKQDQCLMINILQHAC
jgi:hypothetical protein